MSADLIPAADVLDRDGPASDGPSVHAVVGDLARRHPERTAVVAADATLSYGELDRRAGRGAARLGQLGVRPGSHVGVLVEPSAAMVVAALGVLRAGGAYVPVDAAHPDRRIAAVLADAAVDAAVTSTDLRHRLGGVATVTVEDALDGPVAPPVPVRGADAAYVIYTSGSTGRPKGVLVEHAQLGASTAARRRVYPGRAVFLLVSPLAFDSSVAGLWGTLTSGGQLVVAGADDVRDPERLGRLVHRHRVTRTLCVPDLYRVLLDAADRAGHHTLDSLDTVTVAGDVLPDALVERHFRHHPRTALVNEYGPTEAAVWASYHRFTRPGPVTIGRPVPGTHLHVLDGDRRPVPHGAEGELYIGGAGVARGYVGRPDETAAAFVADPVTGARLYRTGDVVRRAEDGTLQFVGRRDHQVKIRGHRVELGAVEAELRGADGVRDAVVVPDEARTGLVGFVVAGPAVTRPALRARLAERLPPAMVPVRVEVLERFPHTVNGKVDRAALAATPAAHVLPLRAGPDDGLGAVAAAWSEVLGVADVPTDVNFFDLGGHSLTMFRLQDALESHTGCRPSVVALFRHTTVAAQAEHLRADTVAATGTDGPAGGAQADRRAAALRARRRRAQQGAGR